MPNVQVSDVKIEEKPFIFEFTKRDFVGYNPTMANLNYDPFPDKDMEDVVRREITCRELVLHAKVRGPDFMLYKPGVAAVIDGHKFAVTSAKMDIGTQTSEIEGSEFQGPNEPLAVLAKLRAAYATDNK